MKTVTREALAFLLLSHLKPLVLSTIPWAFLEKDVEVVECKCTH